MAILSANYANINHDEMADAIGLKAKHIPMLIASFLDESVSILAALDEAISANNFLEIKERAHAIKGSAGNLRFNEVYEMAKDMEFAGAESNSDFDYSGHLEAIKSAIATVSN